MCMGPTQEMTLDNYSSEAAKSELGNDYSNGKENETEMEGQKKDVDKSILKRNLLGFWILGLCNNYSYVVMLSAAHDILEPSLPQNSTNQTQYQTGPNATIGPSSRDGLQCNPLSTGTVLLADIVPALLIKLTAPFYMQRIKYSLRVAFCVLTALGSYFTVAYSYTLWISLLGVIFASISSGFGEITFLSLSAHFNKDVVSTWSSGTGAAGVFGALSYAGLTSAGLSPRNTILVMNVIPVILGISYWFILVHPKKISPDSRPLLSSTSPSSKDDTTPTATDGQKVDFSLPEKFRITMSLLKYMCPLMLVYYAEYFINQGLHELIYWNDIWITPAEQYRWLQVDYQVGVLISRSSVNIFPIDKLWLLTLLQYVNLVVLLLEAYFHYMPSIWIVLAVVLFEGLLGGAVYVNAFYKISKEVEQKYREFSMGVTSVADGLGIAIAGATALPVHSFLCSYWRRKMGVM